MPCSSIRHTPHWLQVRDGTYNKQLIFLAIMCHPIYHLQGLLNLFWLHLFPSNPQILLKYLHKLCHINLESIKTIYYLCPYICELYCSFRTHFHLLRLKIVLGPGLCNYPFIKRFTIEKLYLIQTMLELMEVDYEGDTIAKEKKCQRSKWKEKKLQTDFNQEMRMEYARKRNERIECSTNI